MTNPKQSKLFRTALLACSGALSLVLAGCVVTQGTPPVAHTAPGAPAGATYCQQSSDGHAVQCGGAATYCEQSADGRQVACGGQPQVRKQAHG